MQGANPVNGWGVDASLESRPGVPRHIVSPHNLGNAHWTVPERQTTVLPAARERDHPIPPVYGTANPPRLLSGAIRRAAYTIPGYRPRRWRMLFLADRIDAIEQNLVPFTLAAAVAGALGFAALVALRAARRR